MTYEQEQHLLNWVKADAFYQELLDACMQAAQDYRRIKDNLTEEDREKLDRYISLCEEMEYRRSCIAYSLHPIKKERTHT